MIICDICHGHSDMLPGKHVLPTNFDGSTLTFEKLDICYACEVGMTSAANMARLKFIEKKRSINA